MNEGIEIPEISYTEDYSTGSGGQCKLIFTKDECDKAVWVSSTNNKDDTQHDYSISKKDWEKIKFVVDSFFETC